jgi:hypothetical protein
MRILSLLVALLTVSFGAAAQTWTTYTSVAGHFQIDMPGMPQLSATPVKIMDGNTVVNYWGRLVVGPVAYYVSYGDYPARWFGLIGPEALEQVRDGSARGRTLVRDQPMTVAGGPGREYVVATSDRTISVVRSTLLGTRLYQVVYATMGQIEPTTPDVRRFLDSFALK